MPPPGSDLSTRSEAVLNLGDEVDPKTTPKSIFAGDVNLAQVQKTLGTNWTVKNAKTIVDWMYMGSYQMTALDIAIGESRATIRRNAIFGIVLSTLSGTLSVSTFTISDAHHVYSTITSILFAIFSFAVAIFTGYIKIYQIQERLEEFIKNRQDWVSFTSIITSELQLPEDLRRDALFIIIKYKDTYLDLIKRDTEIPFKIRQRVDEIMYKKQQPSSRLKLRIYTTLADFVYNVQDNVIETIQEERRGPLSVAVAVASDPPVTAVAVATPPRSRRQSICLGDDVTAEHAEPAKTKSKRVWR